MELISQIKAVATATERQRLQLAAGDFVLRSTRLRRYRNQLFMHEDAVLAMSRFPGLDETNAGTLRISALAQRHGIHLAKASEKVTLEEVSAQTAEHLDIDVHTRLLKLDRVVYAAGGYPVEWRVAFCSLQEDMLYLAEMV